MTQKIGSGAGFSPGTFHTSVIILIQELHDHCRRYTLSCFCSVFNWNLCLCHCQKFQWMFRSVRWESVYPECSRFVSQFVHLYVVMWSDSKLVHNYTGLDFHRNYPSSL